MKVRVVRKTPVDENKHLAVAMSQNKKLTDERNARGRGFGECRTIIIEILACINGHLAGAKLSHVSRIHLLPRALETPYRG